MLKMEYFNPVFIDSSSKQSNSYNINFDSNLSKESCQSFLLLPEILILKCLMFVLYIKIDAVHI